MHSPDTARDTSSPIPLDSAAFDALIRTASMPVLVDFYADWCAPCRALAPVLEDLAYEQAGKLVVASVDVDDQLELAERFDVRSIPTLLLFHQGQLLTRITGAASKTVVLEQLEQLEQQEALGPEPSR